MAMHEVTPWRPSHVAPLKNDVTSSKMIASFATQLKAREREQIVQGFRSGSYEMTSSFLWTKTMLVLKKQLSALGPEFIGEMLQKSTIRTTSDVMDEVTDAEALGLAEGLGMVTSTQTLRLRHAQEVVRHFTSADEESVADDAMHREEAIIFFRVCVQALLGHASVGAGTDFQEFRKKIENTTLSADDAHLQALRDSPYFFLQATVRVVLALLKTSTGAQLEHVARNFDQLLQLYWSTLKGREKWDIGAVYAELHSQGKNDAVSAIRRSLLKVSGFDYVPENLRSQTFIKAAQQVIEAHNGFNNFYNEAEPMRSLAQLGTSIPGPALAICITATLSVWLGNQWGHSFAAAPFAQQILSQLSRDRWKFYLDDVLPGERDILWKLTAVRPRERWIELVNTYKLNELDIGDRDIASILRYSADKKGDALEKRASALYMRRASAAAA